MALKFYWRGESATFDGDDYSSGDSTPTDTNITYGTDGAKVGTNGLIAASGVSGNSSFNPAAIIANSADVDTAVGSAGYWWKSETSIGTNGIVYGFRLYSNNTTKAFAVETATGSKLKLFCRNALPETLSADPATAISANTWYFIVVRWDVPNDKMKIEIYTDAGGGTLALHDQAEVTSGVAAIVNSTDFAAATFTLLQWNVKNAAAFRTFTDNMMLCDTYDARIENNAFITTFGQYSDSTGTAITPNPATVSV